MGIEQTVQGYFAGWNAHDAKSLAGLLAPDAIYEDPTTRMAVGSYDLATVVSFVAKVLPDFRFEIVSVLPGIGRAVVEWISHGTNSEPLKPGIEPMGKVIHSSGVEVLEGEERITPVSLAISFRNRCSRKWAYR